jgi:exodeoxyribonuclease V gamma subunit
VHLLALAAGRPGRAWSAATVGRGGDDPVMSALTAPGTAEAGTLLATLARLHRLGLSRPLPLSPRASCAYAEQRGTGSPPRAAAAKAAGEWRRSLGDGRDIGDFDDPEHLRVWGRTRLPDLLVEPARAGEEHADEPHLFGQLARQVFTPLLAHEGMHR